MPVVPLAQALPVPEPPPASAPPRTPRIDILRLACEQAIEAWKAADAEHAPHALMAVRLAQQQITNLKNRNPLLSKHACYLSWVDNWSPPGNS